MATTGYRFRRRVLLHSGTNPYYGLQYDLDFIGSRFPIYLIYTNDDVQSQCRPSPPRESAQKPFPTSCFARSPPTSDPAYVENYQRIFQHMNDPSFYEMPYFEGYTRSDCTYTPFLYEDSGMGRYWTNGTSTWFENQQQQQHQHQRRRPNEVQEDLEANDVTDSDTFRPFIPPLYRTFENDFHCSTDTSEEFARQKAWDEISREIESEARAWSLEEEARRNASFREAERTREVQEEARRLQARSKVKEELRRKRIQEEMRKAREEEERERVRRKKAADERAMRHAWDDYEEKWTSLVIMPGKEDDGAEPLNFSSIPWPTFTKPSGLRSITPEAVSSFLLSPNHSTSQSPRERIKKALRRWHPDKFDRVLKHVVPDERALVEEGAGVVSRILSQLLNRV